MKIVLFGHFGSANTGNESTLVAFLSRLRTLQPTATLSCVCTNPDAVRARYGLDGIEFSVADARVWNPGLPVAKRLLRATHGLLAQFSEYARAFRILKGVDMLIVPGTGILTDAHSLHSWGPYNLFKWALMARLRGARVLVVSVGAGPIDTSIGKLLIWATLWLSQYRSYRDQESQQYLQTIGIRANDGLVYPDLVFGLPEEALPPNQEARPRRIVGLGLMVYSGKYSSSNPHADTYMIYLEALATLTIWLLEHDYDVRLLLGDEDRAAIDDFRSVLGRRLEHGPGDRIMEQTMDSLPTLLEAIASTDIVVATRFHNVLLALVLDIPTIAISFHPKCTSLMSQMRLSSYCHDIHGMDANTLIEQFQALEREHDAVQSAIRAGVSKARSELDHQYDVLFGARN